MFHILGFIFFFVLIILTIGFVILWRIVHTFMGMGKRMAGQRPADSQNSQRQTYQKASNDGEWTDAASGQTTSSSTGRSDKKKVFGEDEGEYVEFEEIKD